MNQYFSLKLLFSGHRGISIAFIISYHLLKILTEYKFHKLTQCDNGNGLFVNWNSLSSTSQLFRIKTQNVRVFSALSRSLLRFQVIDT